MSSTSFHVRSMGMHEMKNRLGYFDRIQKHKN